MDNLIAWVSVKGNYPDKGSGGQSRAKLGITAGLILMLAGLILCAGCTGPKEAPATGNLTVAVTILPQAELVKAVGGDRVDVIVLVPPGADPHTYEPTASQMVTLSKARIYFTVGKGLLPFEDRFASALQEVNRNIRVIDSSSGVEYIEEGGDHGLAEGSGKDPHVWLSVRNGGVMVKNIDRALADADPANAAYYAQNRDAYLARLDTLDRTMNTTLAGPGHRKFIVAHDAWGYFARDYNLTQVPVEAEGKEPSAREIEELISIARREGITVVFVEPQFSTRGAEVIAREINGTVVPIDPLAPDYYDNMVRVSQAFARSTGG
jgi:zinc transport system substrate-binding protein